MSDRTGACGNEDCDKCDPRPRWKISRHRVQHITYEREIKAATAEEAMQIFEAGTAWPSSYDDRGGDVVQEDAPLTERLPPDEYHLTECCWHDLRERHPELSDQVSSSAAGGTVTASVLPTPGLAATDPSRTPSLLRVLIFREGSAWVAQVLEQDLATQAPCREDIEYEIERLVVGHVAACRSQGCVPFELPPAPPRYQDLYEHAKTVRTSIDWWRAWKDIGPLPALEISEWSEQFDSSEEASGCDDGPRSECLIRGVSTQRAATALAPGLRGQVASSEVDPGAAPEASRAIAEGVQEQLERTAELQRLRGLHRDVARAMGYSDDVLSDTLASRAATIIGAHGAVTDRCASLVDEYLGPTATEGPLQSLARLASFVAATRAERDRAVRLHRRALASNRGLRARLPKRRAKRSARGAR